MDPMEAIKQTFFQECDELLADLEAGLLALETGEGDSETVNAMFRAVHSVKGGAGAFGLEALVRFAHVFETTLDEVRAGRLTADDHVVKVMLRSADMLSDHVAEAKGQGEADEARSAVLAAELKAIASGQAAEAPAPAATPMDSFVPAQVQISFAAEPEAGGDEFGFKPMLVQLPSFDEPEAEAAAAVAPGGWTIHFRPHAAMYAKANDAAVLLRELERLGACVTTLDSSALPPLDAMDAEGAYLAWTVQLQSDCPEADIREVFEFVDGDCDLEIARAGVPSVAALQAAPSDEPAVDVQALIAMAQAQVALVEAPKPPPAPAPAPLPAATPSAELGGASAAATAPAEAPRAAVAAVQSTIRVDLERVDRLIDLVGELVINQAMLAQRVTESGFPRSSTVAVGLEDLEQLTREIQDSVMAIRAQPVKSVFGRMPRLVRECAAITGKQVRLVTEGEGTEVDKTVIERLSDPITHMIRNAIDHGLESTEARLAAGKPAEGVVRLAALHRSGRIVIEVGDDGGGINRERVRHIAVKKGLIAADAELTDEEIDNLIFLPGFSTAETLSDLSGRGVGMDVVKRSIGALGGRISITSQPGRGSTFTLSLPLTLAVLDGMVVSVENQTLVAPLTSIIETLQPKPKDVRTVGPNSRVVAVRDAYVPLIDIGMVLGWRSTPLDATAGVCLLVESEVGGRAALLVDAIQGQRQVVIKSLEANYQRVEGIAAATILGDGRVALILDVDAVIASRHREVSRVELPSPLALAS